ncbi:hypothetical protein TIFTF001_033973 [Ficus carica]|uniref:NB-ARC domain-containing protein n=1 Tax=Ficus carica TaxID=3494 RepID=A0AA88E6B7_FICCA|nr:hypothetical protein TIFTF001_033973 [Ficus carica]
METVMDIVDRSMNFEPLTKKEVRLKSKLKHLESREDDIRIELEYAERLQLKRRKVVDNWLTNVANIKEQFQKVDKDIQEKKWYSYGLRETVDELITEATELVQQSGFNEGLTLKADESRGIALLANELVGHMFRKNKDVIEKFLMDDEISIIGIHGMGGVGKTTLAIHVHNQLQKHPGISVFWITVSQSFSIRKLQNDVASKVHLDLSNEDDERIRASVLASALERKRNLVFILDDVWQDFPPNEVGIPVGVNGCKLILTTRLLDVCRKMDCEKEVKVKPLSDEESWELFAKGLWGDSALPLHIEEIAKSLVKECAGLPLGINIMARSMKGVDDICEWRNMLDNLGESRIGQDDMEKVFRVLKHSYEMLNDPKLQQCFLYCSLYPEDFEIDREMLIEYFIDERLIDGLSSRQAEFNRGHTILNKLEKACLLEAGRNNDGKRFVKMHDLVRDMAIQIASVGPMFLVEAGVSIKDIPKDEKWKENLVRVSLMCNRISNISPTASPRCPNIVTLLLCQNFQLNGIPDCFFSHMKLLTVLDLSNTSFESLPNSISNLVCLTSLVLRGCWRLKNVPSLATFKSLRRLDFHKTGITEVPRGIDSLVNLRYLNLDTRTLKKIPTGVLAKLSHLQYLVVHEFEVYTSHLKGEEIANLRELETFKGQFCDINNLNTYVISRGEGGPDKYLVQVVLEGPDFMSKLFKECVNAYDKAVSLRLCRLGQSGNRDNFLLLPRDAQLLHIKRCNDIPSLCAMPSFKKAKHLKKCVIDWCDGMEHVLNSSSYSFPPFQTLESLCLKNLMNLQVFARRNKGTVLSSVIPNGSFSTLKEFSIFGCPNVKRLFSPALLLNFQNLEKIQVQKISPERQEREQTSSTIIALPKFRELALRRLPELRNFNRSAKHVFSNALQCIKIKDCPQLQTVPLLDEQSCRPPFPQKIQVQKIWWDLLEWKQPSVKDALQPIFCEMVTKLLISLLFMQFISLILFGGISPNSVMEFLRYLALLSLELAHFPNGCSISDGVYHMPLMCGMPVSISE